MKLMLTMPNVSPETWCQDITSRPVTLGRDEAADIRLDHRSVSRQHCRFSVEREGCYVEDLSSMNGVYVNSKRVNRCALQSGDRVLIGKFELVVAKDTEVRDTIEGNQLDATHVEFKDPYQELRHLASAVHTRLTPSRKIGLPGLSVEVAYSPSGLLAGDCFLCLETDGRWVLVVLDPMHHGTKSALALSLLRNELQQCTDLTSQPARCLEWLNTELLTLGIHDLYTSACIATWFPETQMLYYGTAGFYPPVVLRAGQPLDLPEYAGGMPLGVDIEERYQENLVQLKYEDRLFLFSDGVRDLFGRVPYEPISKRILDRLVAGADESLETQLERFPEGAGDDVPDDVLIVGAEVKVKM